MEKELKEIGIKRSAAIGKRKEGQMTHTELKKLLLRFKK